MPKGNDISELMVRRMFDVRQFENATIKKVFPLLQSARNESVALVQAMNLGELKTVKGKKRRAELFAQRSTKILDDNFTKLGNTVRSDAKRLARLEADFSADLLQKNVGPTVAVVNSPLALTKETINQIVDLEPIDGITHGKFISNLKVGTRLEMQKRIQIGMFNGESTAELVRRIRGTRAAGFKDGVFGGQARRSIERTVRTTVNHVSNRARMEVYKSNDDITKGYEFVATLDERTTAICQSLDGKKFGYKDSAGRVPPLHPQCRSTIIAIVDWKKLGVEPPEQGMRSSDGGEVSAKETYSSWLKQQSSAKQNRILGKTRAEMFRAGKITLDDLVRGDGRRLTLAELEGKTPLTKELSIEEKRVVQLDTLAKDTAPRNADEFFDAHGDHRVLQSVMPVSKLQRNANNLTDAANAVSRMNGTGKFYTDALQVVHGVDTNKVFFSRGVFNYKEARRLLANHKTIPVVGDNIPIAIRRQGKLVIMTREDVVIAANIAKQKIPLRVFDMDFMPGLELTPGAKKIKGALWNAKIKSTLRSKREIAEMEKRLDSYATQMDAIGITDKVFASGLMEELTLIQGLHRISPGKRKFYGGYYRDATGEIGIKNGGPLHYLTHELTHFLDFQIARPQLRNYNFAKLTKTTERLSKKGVDRALLDANTVNMEREYAQAMQNIKKIKPKYDPSNPLSAKNRNIHDIKNEGETWRPSDYGMTNDKEWVAEASVLYADPVKRKTLLANAPATYKWLDDLYKGKFLPGE